MANASKVVSDYQQAVGQGDFKAARKLLHDKFFFRGPIETFDRPELYLESLKHLHHVIQRIDVKKIFADGDDVCVFYDMVTNTPVGFAFIAEWYQVKGDRITSIQVAFDAGQFAPIFAK